MLALNNLLSVKIPSHILIGKEWFNIFEEVVNQGFDRKHDYEVINIQKFKKIKNCIGSSNIPGTSKENYYI